MSPLPNISKSLQIHSAMQDSTIVSIVIKKKKKKVSPTLELWAAKVTTVPPGCVEQTFSGSPGLSVFPCIHLHCVCLKVLKTV